MTDTERLDWLQKTGASVVAPTNETLVPLEYCVCVNRQIAWVSKPTLREAIDEARRQWEMWTR